MRRFMVYSVSDAAAYRKADDSKDTVYDDIHARVDLVMDKLDDPANPDRPLVVLAHSLGGHIMSNYIWDLQKPGSEDGGGRFSLVSGFVDILAMSHLYHDDHQFTVTY